MGAHTGLGLATHQVQAFGGGTAFRTQPLTVREAVRPVSLGNPAPQTRVRDPEIPRSRDSRRSERWASPVTEQARLLVDGTPGHAVLATGLPPRRATARLEQGVRQPGETPSARLSRVRISVQLLGSCRRHPPGPWGMHCTPLRMARDPDSVAGGSQRSTPSPDCGRLGPETRWGGPNGR